MTAPEEPRRGPCEHTGCPKPGRWRVYGCLLCDDHGLTDVDRRRFGVPSTPRPAAAHTGYRRQR